MSNKAWSYISTPQYAFMEWCSVRKNTRTTVLSPLTESPL